MNEDLIRDMYGKKKSGGNSPSVMPIQLKYAGKSKTVNVNGTQLTIPDIQYVVELENQIKSLTGDLEECVKKIKKLERKIANEAITNRNLINQKVDKR